MAPDPFDVYEDDLSIRDEERLYRLILASNTKFDETGTAERAATNAFQDYPEDRLADVGAPAVAVSVYLESAMIAQGTSPEDLVSRWGVQYGVAVVTAADARSEQQGVTRWPRDGQPEHGMIFSKVGRKKSNGQSKRLAKLSSIVIPPPLGD